MTPKREMWINDNLAVMRGMPDESVDLIYLDPPFNSKREYKAPVGSKAEGQKFDDTWRWDSLNTEWLGEISRENEALSAVIHAARLTQGDGTAAYLTFMGVRMLQMRRLMKPTASIYLHCDPTASHYLKASMDAVWGPANYLSDITWKRYAAHSLAKGAVDTISDQLLYYAKDAKHVFANTITAQPTHEEILDRFKHVEDGTGRRYQHIALEQSSNKASAGEERVIDGRSVTSRIGWRWSQDTFDKRLRENPRLIHWTATGRPRYKKYADEYEGRPVGNIWTDVPYLSSGDKERTGWATQKPLALLQRIIKASSKEGDLVLDPFAGCATACVAAEIENRQWIGIEACEAGAEIVNLRLSDTVLLDFNMDAVGIHHDIPPRQDIKPPRNEDAKRQYRTAENIDLLYGRQRGDCNGCNCHAEARAFHIDHIEPQSKGGTDDISNLQLLCGPCNSTKGDGTMADLWERNVANMVVPSDMVSLLKARHNKQRKALAEELTRKAAMRDYPVGKKQKTRTRPNPTADATRDRKRQTQHGLVA